MAGSGRKWLVGCGMGCAVAALLAIVITVGGGIILTRPLNRAASTQAELFETLGERGDYVPPVEGLTRKQLNRFLAVRRELQPLCADFEEVRSRFRRMEEIDGQDKDPGAMEALRAVGPVIGAALGMVGDIGRHGEARNRALLAQQMSLGEYVWIYVLVYQSWLGHTPGEGIESVGRPGYDSNDRQLVADLLEKYADELVGDGRADEAVRWRAESARVADGAGAPFADTALPMSLRALLEPLRAKLDELYCPASAEFEFEQIHKKGLSYKSE